jgi:hypothetical protein
VRAVAGTVEQLKAGVFVQVPRNGAGVVNAVVVADHHDHRGRWECLGKHPQQGDEVGRAAAAQPVHPRAGGQFQRFQHGDLPVLAGGRDLRAGAAQRPAGPHVRQQVQVSLVFGAHHRLSRQLDQPGDDAGHHVVVVRVAAGG